jgi:hypothetical protein
LNELLLIRKWKTDKATVGELYLNGTFECFTLEDVVRPEKIYGETAIPAGRYRVVFSMSPRFKQVLPLLWEVPNYTGVRIHAGNTAKDTEGCILVGQERGVNSVGKSRAALEALLAKLSDPCWITITDGEST